MMIRVRPRAIAQQVCVDDGFTVGIERAGCLVEHQDARVAHQRPGDRQSLALTAGQIGRPLLNKRFVPGGQPLDEFLGAGQAGRLNDLLESRIGLGGGDGFAERAAEQEILLQHDAEARTQMV